MPKRLVSVLLVLLVVISISTFNVKAADEEYKTFMQIDDRWRYKHFGNGDEIGATGCWMVSYCILFAFADPSLRDVNKWNPGIMGEEGGYLHFDESSCITDPNPIKGPLTYVGSESYYSKEDVNNACKQAIKEGKYIIAWSDFSGTHFSPVTGWDKEGDHPYIHDVGYYPPEEGYDRFTSTGITKLFFYESSMEPSYASYNGEIVGSYEQDNADTKSSEDLGEILSEWDLTGMPLRSKIAAEYLIPSVEEIQEGKDKYNMLQIKENIDLRKKSSLNIANIAVTVFGILLMVYGLLLLISFFFDRFNNFFDFSLISVLSIGRIKLADSGEVITDEMRKQGFVTSTTLLIRIGVIELIGGLLVSGVIVRLIFKIVQAIIVN